VFRSPASETQWLDRWRLKPDAEQSQGPNLQDHGVGPPTTGRGNQKVCQAHAGDRPRDGNGVTTVWTRRLKYWWERDKRSAALRDEMDAHIAERAAELQEQGMTPKHAQFEAWRRFSNVRLNLEASREIWMIRLCSELGQDCRYAFR